MTYEELTEKVERLLNGRSSLDVDVSPDFQCDQTGGYPVSLCVLWDQGKAWLEPNEMLAEDGTDLTYARQGCADFGIRDCPDVSAYNRLLESLGQDAVDMAWLPEEPEEGMVLS